MSNTLEWWTDTICYDAGGLGYVMLQLPTLTLPPLTYRSVVFEPKQELHCSVLCIPSITALAADHSLEQSLRQFVKDFVQSHGISFHRFGAELYSCEHQGARSIVVTARLNGINELFEGIRLHFSQLQQLPDPALHVTLYKYNHRYGIGIQNNEERAQLCQAVPENDLTEVRKVIYHG
ncbi:MAG TPA: hypothetical protein VFZ58_02760 [Candidatus Saccharimonadales bacterium]